MRVEADKAILFIDKYYEHVGKWIPQRKDEWRESGDVSQRLLDLTKRFILQGCRSVMNNKHPLRLILKVRYHNRPKFYLIVRLVHNPDKIYRQLEGTYKYETEKEIPVIGRQVLDGDFKLVLRSLLPASPKR